MKNRILQFLYHHRTLSYFFIPFAILIPDNWNRLAKWRNIMFSIADVSSKTEKMRALPTTIRIAPIAVCNYRCLFCEIHKDNTLYPNRERNEIGVKEIQRYEGLLKKCFDLSFFGGSEEPLMSRSFGKIVQYLKRKYRMRMMVNTNASQLNKPLSKILVDESFDHLLVSYHAGSKQVYRKLMTGNVDKVDQNLTSLREYKTSCKARKPHVAFNYALQRLNASEYKTILKKSQKLGIDKVVVSKYYGGRNRIQDKHVSYDYAMDEGNRMLDEIYAYGHNLGVELVPSSPSYWRSVQKVTWDPDDYDKNIFCQYPWTSLHFNPVLDIPKAHYVGVCNRIELLCVYYEVADFSTPEAAQQLWNHSVIRYLRRTVNSHDGLINPICRYCKNRRREYLRNVNPDAYAYVRDKAVKDFFESWRKSLDTLPPKLQGVTILETNPHSDEHYQEKLRELETSEVATLVEIKEI